MKKPEAKLMVLIYINIYTYIHNMIRKKCQRKLDLNNNLDLYHVLKTWLKFLVHLSALIPVQF